MRLPRVGTILFRHVLGRRSANNFSASHHSSAMNAYRIFDVMHIMEACQERNGGACHDGTAGERQGGEGTGVLGDTWSRRVILTARMNASTGGSKARVQEAGNKY